MFPISLNTQCLKIALIGGDLFALKRLKLLDQVKIAKLDIYAKKPIKELLKSKCRLGL